MTDDATAEEKPPIVGTFLDTPLADLNRQVLTIDELAAYMKVELSTVYRWNTSKTGPRSVKIGKRVFYRIEDIDTWLEQKMGGSS